MGTPPSAEVRARYKRRRKLERRLVQWCFVLVELREIRLPLGFLGAVEDLRAARRERWKKGR